MTLDMVLIILAVICFVLAAFNVGPPRVNLGWIGLALWAITALV